jgi:hypothetical protein
MNNDESGTYCYSWIVIVSPKKTEDIQWIIAAKFRYVVVVFKPCRQLDRCLLAAMTCLHDSSKDATTTFMPSKLSRCI